MAEWEARLDRVMDEAIAANRIVGGVLLVQRHGQLVYRRTAGLADRESGRPIQEDTIFRLASVTKPLVAATALAMIERGTLSFEQKVTDWLPGFRPKLADGRAPDITIRHLLTHTAGFGYATGEPNDPYIAARISGGLAEPGLGLQEILGRIAAAPLFFEPGSAWRYGVNIDVLGAVIAKAHRSLGEAVSEFVTGPLGMTDTGFAVADRSRLAAAYADGESGAVLMGEPHRITFGPGKGMLFSPSRIFNPDSFQSGGAGAAATAPDIFRFLTTIAAGGAPILKPETVEMALTNQVGTLRYELEPGTGFGLISGIMTEPKLAGRPYSLGTARWGGVYGHDWFIDRSAGLTALSMTNTAVEGCMGRYRDDIVEAIYGQ